MANFYDHFSKKHFWQEHYVEYKQDDHQFDWFQNYEGVKDILTQYFSSSARILNIGCGTSKQAEALYNEEYRYIISIDFSKHAVKAMQEKYAGMGNTFRFLCMDAKDMDFRDEMFTHALDKGTLDAVLSGDRSTENAQLYLSEVYRVLCDEGTYMCVSYRDQEHRMRHLKKFDWEVSVHKVYKKSYEQEYFKIKSEFISPAVLKEIAAIKLDDDEKDLQEPEEIEKFQKPKGTIDMHYVYVCKKPKKKEVDPENDPNAAPK